MLYGTEQQSYGTWEMQQPTTPYATNYQSRPQQQSQQRLYQKNDSRMSAMRTYSSSGTPTPAQQNGYQMPVQASQTQQAIQNGRRPNNKASCLNVDF